MNARLYDPVLGRFLSPDPYVQVPDFSQSYNRYSYCWNNPLRYTDPNGEFVISSILIGVGVGAIIGAATAATSYTISAAITGNWDSNSFWKSVGMGAVGGAIGGGISGIGGTFANSLGYNFLSQTGGNIATNAIFGNDISLKAIPGILAGSLVSSILPNYNAVQGGWLRNLATEVGINSGRGAISGTASGLTNALITKDANRIWQNALGGAVNGASTTLATNILFGTGQYYDDSEIFGDKGSKPIYRNGGVLSLTPAPGISWGRTAWANKHSLHYKGDITNSYIHEGTHWRQQQRDGFANFYGTTAKNYISSIIKYGSTTPLYNFQTNLGLDNYINYLPGNYEDIATKYEVGQLKYWNW